MTLIGYQFVRALPLQNPQLENFSAFNRRKHLIYHSSYSIAVVLNIEHIDIFSHKRENYPQSFHSSTL